MMFPYVIDSDIQRAQTLPGFFYSDSEAYQALLERAFAPSWQFIGHLSEMPKPGFAEPLPLLPGSLAEPLLLACSEDGRQHVLSNVCTHRGNLLLEKASRLSKIRCAYHGRRFGLDGKCEYMPAFEAVKDFPNSNDHLPTPETAELGPLKFTRIAKGIPFADWTAGLEALIGFLPLADFIPSPALAQDYTFDAHWVLYLDNYLEGFHIPFVHQSLNQTIDFGSYQTSLLPHGNVQIAKAAEGQLAFDLPMGHPYHGEAIAAFYIWLFPNIMLNFYPWGLSLNLVQPQGIQKTRVSFRSFVWRPELLEQGAGSGLDRVEMEDEAIVMRVQHGVRARLYDRGRYSPSMERGVHQFHSMIAAALQ